MGRGLRAFEVGQRSEESYPHFLAVIIVVHVGVADNLRVGVQCKAVKYNPAGPRPAPLQIGHSSAIVKPECDLPERKIGVQVLMTQ